MTAGVSTISASEVAKHVNGATGALGFLRWVEATFPAPIAAQVLQIAAKKTGALGRLGRFGFGLVRRPVVTRGPRTLYGSRVAGLGYLGDDTALTADLTVTPTAVMNNSPEIMPTVTADTTGASTAPASSSWISSIGNALTNAVAAAGQAYLTVNQVQGANSILQTNLQRAQQGLAPLPYTSQQLGLTGPTLNLGLSSTTLTPLLLLGGGAVLLIALASARKR